MAAPTRATTLVAPVIRRLAATARAAKPMTIAPEALHALAAPAAAPAHATIQPVLAIQHMCVPTEVTEESEAAHLRIPAA